MLADIGVPLAWRVFAVADFIKLTGGKVAPWFEEFRSEADAVRRKKELQASGHIATMQPVYASSSSAVAKVRKKQQWKMPGT